MPESEFDRRTDRDVAAKRVIALWDGIVARKADRIGVRDNWRILIEQVVRCDPEADLLGDPEAQRQIEIIIGGNTVEGGPYVRRGEGVLGTRYFFGPPNRAVV